MTITDINEGLLGLFTKKIKTQEDFTEFLKNANNYSWDSVIQKSILSLSQLQREGFGYKNPTPAYNSYIKTINDRIKYLKAHKIGESLSESVKMPRSIQTHTEIRKYFDNEYNTLSDMLSGKTNKTSVIVKNDWDVAYEVTVVDETPSRAKTLKLKLKK